MKQQEEDPLLGYSLFHEVKDDVLRERNRAVVMCNILEDGLTRDKRTMTAAGTATLLRYFAKIPDNERAGVFSLFRDLGIQKGLMNET
jgi:hypothetical protein